MIRRPHPGPGRRPRRARRAAFTLIVAAPVLALAGWVVRARRAAPTVDFAAIQTLPRAREAAPDDDAPPGAPLVALPYRSHDCSWLDARYGHDERARLFDAGCNLRHLVSGEVRLDEGIWVTRPLAPRKAAGTVRVGLFGGSSVEGYVDVAAGTHVTFGRELAARLGDRFEVLNFGMAGATSEPAIARFLHEGLDRELDVAVFYLGANDLPGCSYFGTELDREVRDAVRSGDVGALAGRSPWFARHEAFLHALHGRFVAMLEAQIALDAGAVLDAVHGAWSTAAAGAVEPRPDAANGTALAPGLVHHADVWYPAMRDGRATARHVVLAEPTLLDVVAARAAAHRAAGLTTLARERAAAGLGWGVPVAAAGIAASPLGTVLADDPALLARFAPFRNLAAALDAAHANGLTPVLVVPPYAAPCKPIVPFACDDYPLAPEDVAAFMLGSVQPGIARLAAERRARGERVALVDLQQALAPDTAAGCARFFDVVHLEPPGLEVIGERLAVEILRLVDNADRRGAAPGE